MRLLYSGPTSPSTLSPPVPVFPWVSIFKPGGKRWGKRGVSHYTKKHCFQGCSSEKPLPPFSGLVAPQPREAMPAGGFWQLRHRSGSLELGSEGLNFYPDFSTEGFE